MKTLLACILALLIGGLGFIWYHDWFGNWAIPAFTLWLLISIAASWVWCEILNRLEPPK